MIVVCAHDDEAGIGKSGAMPWHISSELKNFKAITAGGTVVMGSKTWKSIGEKKLPGRKNVVLSRNPDTIKGCDLVLSSLHDLKDDGNTFIIGGGEVIKQALLMDIVTEMYLTHVDGVYDCDTFLPPFDASMWGTVPFTPAHPRTEDERLYKIVHYVK